MTKGEYKDSLVQNMDETNIPISKKEIKKRVLVLIVFLLLSILITFVSIKISDNSVKKYYKELVSNNALVKYEYLDYNDSFLYWIERDTKNDPNALMTGGRIYSRDEIQIHPKENASNISIIQKNGKVLGQIDGPISFINVVNDNCIFYRKDGDRCIYSNTLEGNHEKNVVKGNYGEIFATNEYLYCIDYDNSNSLIRIDPDVGIKETIGSGSYLCFVIVGESAICLERDGDLVEISVSSGSVDRLAKDVEGFFINGSLIIESNNQIFKCSPLGNDTTSLLSNDETIEMVGCGKEGIYIEKEGKLFLYSLNSKWKTIFDNEKALFDSIVENENGEVEFISHTDTTESEPEFKYHSIKIQ